VIALDLVVARARAAVLGRGVLDPIEGSGALPIAQDNITDLIIKAHTDEHYTPHPDVKAMAGSLVTVRPVVAPAPMVRPRYTPPAPAAPVWPSYEVVTGDRTLSKGASRVFGVLHGLAVSKGRFEGFPVVPDTVVLHIPAQLVALGCGIGRTTLYRVLPELVDAGLLAFGGQAQKVRDMGLFSGVLWAVKTSAAAIVPRLTRTDWKTEHRDFAADIDAGRTVKALVEGLEHLQGQEKTDSYREALESWPMRSKRPPAPVDDVGVRQVAGNLLEVSYRLGDLVRVQPDHLQQAVTETATALASAMRDLPSRAWYAGLVHTALEGEREGRGSLGVLAAQLVRVHHDVQDWQELRNPAALLASRLRSA